MIEIYDKATNIRRIVKKGETIGPRVNKKELGLEFN
jgi:hypothetical protein